jgi:hypothetical protein
MKFFLNGVITVFFLDSSIKLEKKPRFLLKSSVKHHNYNPNPIHGEEVNKQ